MVASNRKSAKVHRPKAKSGFKSHVRGKSGTSSKRSKTRA